MAVVRVRNVIYCNELFDIEREIADLGVDEKLKRGRYIFCSNAWRTQ